MANPIFSKIKSIVSSYAAQELMEHTGITNDTLYKLLEEAAKFLIEKGIDVTYDYLKNYAQYSVSLDFDCDIVYTGGFDFIPPYSENHLAYLPPNPKYGFVFNVSFRVLASGYLHGAGVVELPKRGYRFERVFYDEGHLPNGEGVCFWPDGGFYIGKINHRGAPNGYGMYIYPNGRVHKGEWESSNPKDLNELKIFDPLYYNYLTGK